MAELTTTVTFLEMTAEPLHHVPLPSGIKLMLMRTENITLAFYRFLYDAVGGRHAWLDRKHLSDADLSPLIHGDGVEIWVLYGNGQPAGYFELGPAGDGTVEIEYFGLIPEFQGLGLGRWLLAEAIRAGWARQPNRLIVQTCTLDGPAALPLYQKMGFVPYDQQVKAIAIKN
jgi:GNAT superfamily N-acetyltransferase